MEAETKERKRSKAKRKNFKKQKKNYLRVVLKRHAIFPLQKPEKKASTVILAAVKQSQNLTTETEKD